MMIRTRSRRSALLAALALAAAACDGGSGGEAPGGVLPGTQPLQLTMVGGTDQEAAPGEQLKGLLVVRATRNGRPAAGVPVAFTAAPGSGTAQVVEGVTNISGEAFAFWRLPAERAPSYTLTATAEGADPIVFRSTPVAPERLDAIYTDYAGPVRVLLYEREHFPEDERLFRATLRDSLLFPPFGDPRQRNEAVAFAEGHPPLLVNAVTWTTARDSLQLQFLPRVRVPLTLWVVDGPWEEVGPLARTQAQNARDAWRAAGVELEITIVDATRYPGAAPYQDTMLEMCENGVVEAIGKTPGHLNAYYVWDIQIARLNQGAQGAHCGGGYIEMAAGDTRATHLLAHEVGHAFSLLDHSLEEGNVMHAFRAGPNIGLGQRFRSHFYMLSWIQEMKLGSQPSVARSCHTFVFDHHRSNTRPCPSEQFN